MRNQVIANPSGGMTKQGDLLGSIPSAYQCKCLTRPRPEYNTTADAGGGIYNVGTMTVSDSTFSANGGTNPDGGAIYNEGTLTLTSSTLSGNGGVNAYGGAV